MTPLMRLCRVQTLWRQVQQAEGQNKAAIEAEIAMLMASVDRPPEQLETNCDPQAWAENFTSRFAHIDVTTAWHWFHGALKSGIAAGRTEGRIQGEAQGRGEVQALVNVLSLIEKMLESKRLTGENPRDDNPDAPPITLQQMIEKALAPFR